MGLRDRVRARVRRTLKRVTERVIGAGPFDGEVLGARSSAWPADAMGAAAPANGPIHPAVLAAQGRLHEVTTQAEPVADFGEGDWVDAPAEPPPNGTATEPLPMGSVAQDPYLPIPEPTPTPARVEEPVAPTPVAPPEAALDEIVAEGEAVDVAPPTDAEKVEIEEKVVAALKTIYDPEIPIDIYELGLIYDVDVAPDRTVEIKMTLTSPNCPAAQSLPAEVEVKSAAVDGVRMSMVDIVWEPPWGPDHMSEAAKLELNIDY